MAKKRDKGLLYDTTRLEDFNNELKKNSLYSNYVWTGDLHAISKTYKPEARPEFRNIMQELGKYKEKKTPKVDTLIQSSRSSTEFIDEYLRRRVESLQRSNHRNSELAKRFQNIYKEVFESSLPISKDSNKKHQHFVEAITNAKNEITLGHLPPVQENVARKQQLKNSGSTALLSRPLQNNSKILIKKAASRRLLKPLEIRH